MAVFLTEYYQEDSSSTFTSDGVEYNLNIILRYAHKLPSKTMPIKLFDWHKKYTSLADLDANRVDSADLNYPVLYIVDPKYGYTIIDGTHRLFKSFKLNLSTIKAKEIPLDVLVKAKIS